MTFLFLYAKFTFSYFIKPEKLEGKFVFPDFCSYSPLISIIFPSPLVNAERWCAKSNNAFNEVKKIVLIKINKIYTDTEI